MNYQVRLRRAARKQLDTLPERDFETVARVISSLEQDPRPSRVKKLAESGLWRVRVGRYRVVYAVDDGKRSVVVVRVARRREDTYTNL